MRCLVWLNLVGVAATPGFGDLQRLDSLVNRLGGGIQHRCDVLISPRRCAANEGLNLLTGLFETLLEPSQMAAPCLDWSAKPCSCIFICSTWDMYGSSLGWTISDLLRSGLTSRAVARQ
ncbi:hypothetical protein ACWEOO_06765 [Kribbella sp. NPDC004138]